MNDTDTLNVLIIFRTNVALFIKIWNSSEDERTFPNVPTSSLTYHSEEPCVRVQRCLGS